MATIAMGPYRTEINEVLYGRQEDEISDKLYDNHSDRTFETHEVTAV